MKAALAFGVACAVAVPAAAAEASVSSADRVAIERALARLRAHDDAGAAAAAAADTPRLRAFRQALVRRDDPTAAVVDDLPAAAPVLVGSAAVVAVPVATLTTPRGAIPVPILTPVSVLGVDGATGTATVVAVPRVLSFASPAVSPQPLLPLPSVDDDAPFPQARTGILPLAALDRQAPTVEGLQRRLPGAPPAARAALWARIVALDPADAAAQAALRQAALDAGRDDLLVRQAWQEGPRAAGVERAAPLELEVVVGCRGDRSRAVIVSDDDGDATAILTQRPPRHACLAGADVDPCAPDAPARAATRTALFPDGARRLRVVVEDEGGAAGLVLETARHDELACRACVVSTDARAATSTRLRVPALLPQERLVLFIDVDAHSASHRVGLDDGDEPWAPPQRFWAGRPFAEPPESPESPEPLSSAAAGLVVSVAPPACRCACAAAPGEDDDGG